MWDTAGTGTRWPQSAHGQVGVEVGDFGKLKREKTRFFSKSRVKKIFEGNRGIQDKKQTYSPNSSTDPEEPLVIPDSIDDIRRSGGKLGSVNVTGEQ